MRLLFCALLLVGLLALQAATARGTAARIRNDIPRLDVDGNIIDAHDGCIVAFSSFNDTKRPTTYFLYGSAFGNQSGPYPSTWSQPKALVVYTSPDLMAWTFRGPTSPDFNYGTGWIPAVIVDSKRQRFVMWFGCGQWCVCVSMDGLQFTNCTVQKSRYGSADTTDGTGLFIDDDGTGYIAFSSPNHGVTTSIEKLTEDYLASSKELVAGPFPDVHVENPSILKRPGGPEYYLTYGGDCCACAVGCGQVVFWAPAIIGPWQRQYPYGDIACQNPTATICGGDHHPDPFSVVWPAQWAHISLIPLANRTTQMLMLGHRWLSGPSHPPFAACPGMCTTAQQEPGCVDPQYHVGEDYEVWQPIYFSADGHVLPMVKAEDFTLELP